MMTFASRTQIHIERPWGQRPFSIVSFNSVLNVKAVVAAFNQEKALVGAFSVTTNLRMKLFQALLYILMITANTSAAPWPAARSRDTPWCSNNSSSTAPDKTARNLPFGALLRSPCSPPPDPRFPNFHRHISNIGRYVDIGRYLDL